MRRLAVIYLTFLALAALGATLVPALATPPSGQGPPVAQAPTYRGRVADTMDGNQAPAYVSVAAGLAVQPAATETHVLSNFNVLTDANGFANLPEFSGSGDGVRGADCGGAFPIGGTVNIPKDVVTHLKQDLTYMRIWNANGGLLRNRLVSVNCTLEVESGEPAAAKIAALAAQTRP